jgi:hypothetical protein
VMGIEPEKTIYDPPCSGRVDIEKLAGYTTKHPCGSTSSRAAAPEDAELSRSRRSPGCSRSHASATT